MTTQPAYAASEVGEEIYVSISEAPDGSHILAGGFSIGASTGTAWAVLTDYDEMASFVTSIKSSRSLKRDDKTKTVEQVMSGKVGFFRKRVHLLLNVVESTPRTIAFRDVSKKSLKFYEGNWQIEPRGDRIQINYRLKAKPDFFFPDFLAVKAFKNTVKALLTEIRDEIQVREGGRPYL